MQRPPKRVLFVASVYQHLAHFHLPFMKMLQEQGHEVHAAASSILGGKGEVVATGVTCWDVPFARSPFSPSNFRAVLDLWRVFSTTQFDLIHVHTPVAAFLGRLLAKLTGQGEVIYTAHGFHFYKGAPWYNWLIYHTAERIAARWTDGLIVMNGEDFESAKKLGFRPEVNLFYVRGVGLDINHFAVPPTMEKEVRASLNISDSDIVVTCIAELNENKNQGFLLEAWRDLSKRHNHVQLLLVGQGEKLNYLQSRVAKEGMPRVHFLGHRRDIPQILWESDIITLVSKREGLPRCIMEAMAASKPVVATNVRGNRDLVDDGRTGCLVELGDVVGLTQVVDELVLDHELQTAMGIAAREKVQDYSLEKVIAELAIIYDRFLGIPAQHR